MIGRRLLALAGPLLIAALASAPAQAGEATEQIKADVARVFRVLAALPGRKQVQARRQAIEEASRGMFDLNEMARRALGRTWEERTDAERATFLQLLETRVDTHLVALESYGGATITWGDETLDGERAVVRSRVTPSNGRDLGLDYRLVRRDERWRIWDVVVDNASLVEYYRAQFQKVIRTASFEKLIEKLSGR